MYQVSKHWPPPVPVTTLPIVAKREWKWMMVLWNEHRLSSLRGFDSKMLLSLTNYRTLKNSKSVLEPHFPHLMSLDNYAHFAYFCED